MYRARYTVTRLATRSPNQIEKNKLKKRKQALASGHSTLRNREESSQSLNLLFLESLMKTAKMGL